MASKKLDFPVPFRPTTDRLRVSTKGKLVYVLTDNVVVLAELLEVKLLFVASEAGEEDTLDRDHPQVTMRTRGSVVEQGGLDLLGVDRVRPPKRSIE